MNPQMFYKLIEKKLITVGTNIGVEYGVYEDQKKTKTVKGVYQIESMGMSPLGFGLVLEIKNDTDTASIELGDIKMISGLTPIKFAASHGVRPDGKTDDAPKRRGRKPKIRNPEQEWDMSDEEEDEAEEA